MREVKCYREGKEVREKVAEEKNLRVTINGVIVADAKLSPSDEEEFALGYCVSEGLIKDPATIQGIEIDGSQAKVEVKGDFETDYEKYISTDCMSGWRVRSKAENVHVDSDLVIEAQEIFNNMRELQKRSRKWKETGGLHSVGLVTPEQFVVREDVSRHVALDKALGFGIREKVDFSRSYILTTGRLPGDMVIKVARMGVPIIASRTAPISSGIECAQNTNLTLIGFVRGKRMNIYTHPERISE